MQSDAEAGLSPAEQQILRRVAGIMIPANTEYGVPGADDPLIIADIVRSLGRDANDVRAALAEFAASGDADGVLAAPSAAVAVFGRVVLQCYYRDDRVLRSLGVEPRPPFPKGHTLEQGDWSLLDAVRGRPKLWRDDKTGKL